MSILGFIKNIQTEKLKEKASLDARKDVVDRNIESIEYMDGITCPKPPELKRMIDDFIDKINKNKLKSYLKKMSNVEKNVLVLNGKIEFEIGKVAEFDYDKQSEILDMKEGFEEQSKSRQEEILTDELRIKGEIKQKKKELSELIEKLQESQVPDPARNDGILSFNDQYKQYYSEYDTKFDIARRSFILKLQDYYTSYLSTLFVCDMGKYENIYSRVDIEVLINSGKIDFNNPANRFKNIKFEYIGPADIRRKYKEKFAEINNLNIENEEDDLDDSIAGADEDDR